MHLAGMIAVSDDGLRAYIRARREHEGYTQETLAKAIGLPYPTYRDWESGQTQELKARPFARAVEVLRIPLQHIMRLGRQDIAPDDARLLAHEAGKPMPRDPELDAIIAEEYERKQGHGQERMRAAHILEDLIDRPELLEAWLLFGEHLLSRRQ